MYSLRLLTFLLVLVFCQFMPLSANCQSPYAIEWKNESYLLGAGMAMHSTSAILRNQIRPLSQASILNLMNDDFDDFDEQFVTLNSKHARSASDIMLHIGMAMPATLLISKNVRSESAKIALLLAETYCVVSGVTYLAKNSVLRPRPFVLNPDIAFEEKQSISARLSFFSGHTSLASGLSFFSARVFSDYHPDSKLKPYVWASAALVPAVTGYLRVKAGKHYPSDVITGYLVGGLAGILIPEMHKQSPGSKIRWRMFGGARGASLQLLF